MSFDVAASMRSPRPDPNARFVGMVQGCNPDRLEWLDFSIDIPEIAALAGEDFVENIGDVRQVAPAANVDPYQHRVEIFGRPAEPDAQRFGRGRVRYRNALTVTAWTLEV